MSRQEEAKIQQRFIKKPIWSTCSNCVNYRFDNVKNEYGYTEEKNLRCSIGYFKVGKTDTCKLHIEKKLWKKMLRFIPA